MLFVDALWHRENRLYEWLVPFPPKLEAAAKTERLVDVKTNSEHESSDVQVISVVFALSSYIPG